MTAQRHEPHRSGLVEVIGSKKTLENVVGIGLIEHVMSSIFSGCFASVLRRERGQGGGIKRAREALVGVEVLFRIGSFLVKNFRGF